MTSGVVARSASVSQRALSIATLVAAPLFHAARCQATRLIPPDAPVYRDLERFAAAGLIDTGLLGLLPLSEREIRRLLDDAKRHLDRPAAGGWVERALAVDLATYATHQNRAFDALRLETVQLDAAGRPAPSDELGGIDAVIEPLASDRGGRPVSHGTTIALETTHTLALGSAIAVMINPRFTSTSRTGSPLAVEQFAMQTASASVLIGTVGIELGRDYAIFGPTPSGGLLLSTSAPPLNLGRVFNDTPVTLPWVLRSLGPLRGSVFVADLGTERQIFPHSQLAGLRVSALPQRNLELGIDVIDEMGGRGSPPGRFADRILDLLVLPDALTAHSSLHQFSNKIAGADARWRLPALAGLEVYAEGAPDDFDIRRLKSSLLEDTGWIGGISLSCIRECGRLGLRAEYHQTGIRYYTHGQFASGIQENGIMLGDPLGPRGLGGFLTVDREDESRGLISLTAAYEARSGDKYAVVDTLPQDRDFHFVQVEHHPAEHRARVVASWSPDDRAFRSNLTASAGVEHVTNFAFVDRRARWGALVQLRYEVRP